MTPLDQGPLYTETNMAQFPVEPYNTLSNILFLIVALIWTVRLKKIQDRDFRNFLKINLPLLFVGYVGGTIYHATRSHLAWMLMDVLPIYLIGFLTALYHWKLIKTPVLKVAGIFLFFFVIPFSVFRFVLPPTPNTATLGYISLAIPVILPILLDQIKTQWVLVRSFLIPLLLLLAALFFRAADSTHWVQMKLPMGTHWIWHTLGALTCHWLLVYMRKRSLLKSQPSRGKTIL